MDNTKNNYAKVDDANSSASSYNLRMMQNVGKSAGP